MTLPRLVELVWLDDRLQRERIVEGAVATGHGMAGDQAAIKRLLEQGTGDAVLGDAIQGLR